ncbi:DUF2975 domain-containing protein [Paenibacillus sp. NEAU-GSW1]|uniref:DUF2975 domain-containing protein n=1 Tax=Paenibacillus sp. NEAU-GSW1 TaxID=2682486 RepID=UPI0012E1D300|nr:DUF2975 domain-containing protein [Paenibacillus sp. NEAU-GSW1]MUT67167.1 DUF2975 domain-containing protein [Paenibacillus sp. NEAU-GSW1]
MKKRISTLFLKIAVLVMGILVMGILPLVVCIFALLVLFRGTSDQFPGKVYLSDIVFFIPIIPFYIALYQTYKLLLYIDNNIAFSELSVRALHVIKYCGFSESIIYLAMEPFLFNVAKQEDASGIILLGLVAAFASFVLASFGALLKRLLQDALKLHSENELTV